MSDYTPDWIHVYSGYRHFLPPATALAITLGLGVLVLVFRQMIPRHLSRFFALIFLGLTISVVFLTLRSHVAAGWATRAINYGEEGTSQKGVSDFLLHKAGLSLTDEFQLAAGVTMGWQDSKTWLCFKESSNNILKQLAELGYEQTPVEASLVDHLPLPIAQWRKDSEFQPDSAFTRVDAGQHVTISLDSRQNLIFVIFADL